MAAKNVNFKWYQYTDNQGGTWAMKVSTLVGDDVAFGFGAFSVGDRVLRTKGRYHGRGIQWIDPNTGRMTFTPVGNTTATKWGTPGTYTGYGKDTTTDIVYDFYAYREERLETGHNIVSKPEPA